MLTYGIPDNEYSVIPDWKSKVQYTFFVGQIDLFAS